MATAAKAARGTKRTCQNSACNARFYDLNRDPIVCPICESEYVIAVAPDPAMLDKSRKPATGKTPTFVQNQDDKVDALPEGSEELADLEVDDDAADVPADETFLEEDEDEGSDVTGFVNEGDDKED